MVEILAEIVGGYKLQRSSTAKATTSADGDLVVKPYCLVRLGKKVIHQTKKAEGGRNPVWTVSTGAFFLIQVTEQALEQDWLSVSVWYKQKDSLQLTVVDTYCLGQVRRRLSDIFMHHCDESRLELDLCDPSTKQPCPGQGSVTLRFRMATKSDKRFLSALESEPKLLKQKSVLQNGGTKTTDSTEPMTSLLVTEANETDVAGASFMNVLSSALTSKTYIDQTTGQSMRLVKPHPDPERVGNTTYLCAKDFSTETMAPSKQWIEAGSGDLGKVYLEILSCHGLPNLDVGGEAMGNVTDAFVCAVFEDAMVQTPVIDDELSPHWLPWTSRAFVFRMMHPASNLYLAAFDFDLGLSSHDPIGRVVVNLANLQPQTEYTLKYNLFPSSNVTDRTAAGCIMLRVRVEYDDPKTALMQTLKPRPRMHINVRKEKSLAVLRYTCFGERGQDNEFDLTVVRSYINEIFEYKRAIAYYFGDSFRSLMFWRGQVKVGKVLLPIHSLLFFLIASTLVERPYLFPSFFLLSVAWILISNHVERTQHPSPWYRSLSFRHYIDILRTGHLDASMGNIEPYEGKNDGEAYEKAWCERQEKDQAFAAQQAAMQQEIIDIGDETIQTKTESMIPLDLLIRLARYQAIVGGICKQLRMVKIVLTWEENYLSFWISAAFLVTGVVSLVLPWAFILLWTSRLVVWGLFGPHMKFIDLILRANGDGADVLEKAIEKFRKESVGARIRHQEAVKLRDMKCLAFGKYITLVPSHNLSRHFDRPLPESFAKHNPAPLVSLAPHGVPGQQLFGTVLPRTEHENELHSREMAENREAVELLETRLEEQQTLQSEKDVNISHDSTMESLVEELNDLSARSLGQEDDIVSSSETGLRRRNVANHVNQAASKNSGSTSHDAEVCTQPLNAIKSTSTVNSGFGWFGNQTGLAQVDEEREVDGVEVVLSGSMTGSDDCQESGQRDDASASELSRLLFFQPKA